MNSDDFVFVYSFLTHAIKHCQWGAPPIIRDEWDMQAARILVDLRTGIAREHGCYGDGL